MARGLHIRPDRSLVRAAGRSRRHLCVDVVAPRRQPRRAVSLGLVLDQSGSMAGAKMKLAREGAIRAIRSLREEDRLSVVAYNEEVHLLLRSAPADDAAKRAGEHRLHQAQPEGNTDLCQGWLRGCEQVGLGLDDKRLGRCLLLTDGLANQGVTDRNTIVQHAAELRQRGVTTSTLGVGRDFDEGLLRRMAEAGGGNFYFAQYETQLSDFIAGETGESLKVVARDAVLVVDLPAGASLVSPNSYRIRSEPGRSVVEIGNLVSDQVLSLVLTVQFPEGKAGESALLQCWLWDADGVLGGSAEQAFGYAGKEAYQAQPRDSQVDRTAASTYAAAARRRAADLAREGSVPDGQEVLRKMARDFRGHASHDPEIVDLANSLEQEAERLGQMDSVEAKQIEFGTFGTLHSRGMDGLSIGMACFTADRFLAALKRAQHHGHPQAPLVVSVITADLVGTRIGETAGRALAAVDPRGFAYTIVDSAAAVLDPGPSAVLLHEDELTLVHAIAEAGDTPKVAIVHGALEDGAPFHWHATPRASVASLEGWSQEPGGSAEAFVAHQMVLQASRMGQAGSTIPVAHTDRRGCWGDPCSTAAEVYLMLKTAGICSDCLRLYETSGVSPDQLLRLVAAVRVLAQARGGRN
jgi:Ca-activated chloride channel homolog